MKGFNPTALPPMREYQTETEKELAKVIKEWMDTPVTHGQLGGLVPLLIPKIISTFRNLGWKSPEEVKKRSEAER